MQVFITGTDTNIGKTTVSSWLCLHTRYDYFKPIQTGYNLGMDSHTVSQLAQVTTHKEIYCYEDAVSPHLAAKIANTAIDVGNIRMPLTSNVLIEGAGGVLVPINEQCLMIDLITQLHVPVIIVASSRLGTINHTLLTLNALRSHGISIVGVIVNGPLNQDNCDTIEFYGKIRVLAQLPHLAEISSITLKQLPLTDALNDLFEL